ncbi:MAG TPA: VOC family protein [Gemmatimonadales bacterium]|nr:VOC family protein [Gemmatimonadales bacterium]
MSATTATPGLLQGIGQIAIRTKEQSRAVAFYRDVLGMSYLFEAPSLAFFQCGGVMLMLSPDAETAEFDHAASVLYFDVAEIQDAYRTLLTRGVHFRDEPHIVHRAGDQNLWMSFFDDGEGNVFAIRQWRPA